MASTAMVTNQSCVSMRAVGEPFIVVSGWRECSVK